MELQDPVLNVNPNVPDQALTDEAAACENAVAENEQTQPATQADLVIRLTEISQLPDTEMDSDEIARLKQQFYFLHNEAIRAAHQQYVEEGGDPATFTPAPSQEEALFKALLAEIKEKKAAMRARIEAEQLANLERKKAILAELNDMASDTDNVNRHYTRAKELQAEFKATGDVPQENTTEIWKQFQDTVELFYDQWKVNKELRDYDFKKNLAEKQLIISQAVELTGEADVITAFKRLQELHDKWRATGPVAKEFREEIWNSFKDASAEINKRYQAYFEERKKHELENEAAKTALCEKVEAIDIESLNSFNAWNKATDEIRAIQEEWKGIGYASRKANNALFGRLRQACDKFFTAKAQYYRNVKDDLAANLAAKTALCEQAEALMDSTQWRSTTDKILDLQAKWKAIGAVPRKHSDAVWQRFMKACNHFFDRKKKENADTRRSEQANLRVKREIVDKLTALNEADGMDRQQAIDQLQELRSLWQSTGHVPFRDKEKLAEAYREIVGKLYDKYDVNETRARKQSFQSSIESMGDNKQKLNRERERLVRAYEARRNELKTYENNLSFLSAKSKKGSSMLVEMEHNIQRLKNSIAELEEKINLIDSKI